MNHPLSTNWSGGFGNEVYRPRAMPERVAEESRELKKETTTPTKDENELKPTPRPAE